MWESLEHERFTWVEEDQIWEYLTGNAAVPRLCSDVQVYPWVLRELADCTNMPPSVIYETLCWSGVVPEDWKNVIPLTVG